MKTTLTATTLCMLMLIAIAPPLAANVWNERAPMPNPRSQDAVGAINGILYVAGGLDPNGQETATLQAYDVERGSWTTLANMPAGRYEGDGTGVINSQLYVAGGWTVSGRLPTDTLYRYDPPSNTWATLAPLSHLSGCGGTDVIDGQLYVTTACNGFSDCTPLLDVYNPLTNSWTSLANSNDEHLAPAVGAINGKLYVAGGQGCSGQLTTLTEVYDPATNQWTTLAPMPIALTQPASVALNGLLWVFGGYDSHGNTLNTVLAYDPHLNVWLNLTPSMPTARLNAGAAVVYGMAFVEGGTPSEGGDLPTNESFTEIPYVP